MLTGKELYESGMLIGALEGNIQQHGVDIRIDKVSKINGLGVVLNEGDNVIPNQEEIKPLRFHNKSSNKYVYGWMLPAGVYTVEFIEGLNAKANACISIIANPALVRCGAFVNSEMFTGTQTEKTVVMLHVTNNILIEKGTPVARAVCFETNDINNI